jgi:SAM-dependent methyltransferase
VTGQWLPGVHPAPNIQEHPDLYELENRAADPDGRIEQAMWELAPWAGEVVLDLGAGTGFHLARFHRRARHVVAVEPDDWLRLLALERVAALGLERVSVLTGSAERLLLADRSIGVAQARFAYLLVGRPRPDRGLLARPGLRLGAGRERVAVPAAPGPGGGPGGGVPAAPGRGAVPRAPGTTVEVHYRLDHRRF